MMGKRTSFLDVNFLSSLLSDPQRGGLCFMDLPLDGSI